MLGLFYAAFAVGALLVTLTSGWTFRVHRHGLAVTLAALAWGGGIVILGLADSLWLALLGLIIAGGADMISGLFRGVIWNQTIPNHLRGRLAGIEMLSYMTGPMLGNTRAGLTARWWGTAARSSGAECTAWLASSPWWRCCPSSCATTAGKASPTRRPRRPPGPRR